MLVSGTACIINPRRPTGGGGGVPPPYRVFHDSSEHAGDRELKLGIPDLWSKPHLVTPTAFSGQVRSLTCDVISEPLHSPQMSQRRQCQRNFHREMKLTGCSIIQRSHNLYIYLGFSLKITWGQVGHVTSPRYKSMGKNENCYVSAENYLKLSPAHGIAISCTPCKVRCFTFALLTLRGVIYGHLGHWLKKVRFWGSWLHI